jgi:hypothetical protein
MTDAEKAQLKIGLAAEIAEINTALSQIRKAGQSYMIMSASGAGTNRTMTMADYQKLVDHRNDLQRQLNTLSGNAATRIRAGW